MDNKLYSLNIRESDWNGKQLSFNLDNLDVNISDSIEHYRFNNSDGEKNSIFITKTKREEYKVKSTSIKNGKILLNLDLVEEDKAISPSKGKVTLFVNNEISEGDTNKIWDNVKDIISGGNLLI